MYQFLIIIDFLSLTLDVSLQLHLHEFQVVQVSL